MQQFIPYLGFDGNCKEAMQFYEKVFGGKLIAMMSFVDMGMAEGMPADMAKRIVHACLVSPENSYLYGGDAPGHIPFEKQNGVTVTMSYDTVTKAEQVFKLLSDGGNVTMPMMPTQWAKMFGMVTDRYGTSWAVNGEQIPIDRMSS